MDTQIGPPAPGCAGQDLTACMPCGIGASDVGAYVGVPTLRVRGSTPKSRLVDVSCECQPVLAFRQQRLHVRPIPCVRQDSVRGCVVNRWVVAMAYGQMDSARLHVTDRPHTVTAVTSTLMGIDYAYNLVAFIELCDQGYKLDSDTVLNLLSQADSVGIAAANFGLHATIPVDARLQLELLEFDASFTIGISGIGRVIEALISVFDPLARKERREDLRHKREMNLSEEDLAKLSRVDKRLEIAMRVLSDDRSNVNARWREALGPERASQMRMLAAQEFGRAIDSLPDSLKAIEAPTD